MTDIGGISSNHLRQFIERIERLEEEKSALAEDIRELIKTLSDQPRTHWFGSRSKWEGKQEPIALHLEVY